MIAYDRNGIVVREARESDIISLKDRLRDADQKEIIAAGNASGEEVLTQSFTRSQLRYTVDLEGIPVGMFGVLPDGNVWFLGAKEMNRIKKTFVKLSRLFIAEFLVSYPVLWNVIDSRYVSSISWIKACGAVFHPEPVLFGEVKFYGFIIKAGGH